MERPASSLALSAASIAAGEGGGAAASAGTSPKRAATKKRKKTKKTKKAEGSPATGATSSTQVWSGQGFYELVSFGEDQTGELYVVKLISGEVWKMVPAP